MVNKQIIRLTESDLHRIVKESLNKILKENDDVIHEGWVDNIKDTYHDMVTSRVNPEKYQRYRQNRYYQNAKNTQQQGKSLSASQKAAIKRGDDKLAQRKTNSQKMTDNARSRYVDIENGRSNPYRTDATVNNAQIAKNAYQTYLKRNNNIQKGNNPY